MEQSKYIAEVLATRMYKQLKIKVTLPIVSGTEPNANILSNFLSEIHKDFSMIFETIR